MPRGAVHCLLGLAAVLIASLGGLGVLPSAADAKVSSESFQAVPPTLQAAGHQLGIPASTLTRLQVRWGLPRDLHGTTRNINGAYQDGHIYLRRTAHPINVLAYEYLHDVWARLAPAQRVRVTALLNEFDDEHHGTLEPGFSKLI